MTTTHDEEMIEVREDYGFKAGLRQKPLDITRRNEWLEKFNVPYGVSMKGLLLLIVGIGMSNTICISYITNDLERAKFITPGVLLIDLAICLFVALASFTMPAYGSPLKSGITLIIQITKSILIKMGLRKPERETGFTKVRRDGRGLTSNGDYSDIYKVDGRTSATAYPSEISKQEEIMSRYHNGRSPSTTEFHITVSQRQNAEKQINNLESIYNSTNRKSIQDLANIEKVNLEKHVNGVKPVAEHYLIQRSTSEQKLNESAERLKNFVTRDNMYNSIVKMNQEESEEFYDNFFKFK